MNIKKKIAAFVAALGIVAGPVVFAQPAQATSNNIVCNQSAVTGDLTVVSDGTGLWAVKGTFHDNASRQWGWELYHNGSQFVNGSHAGSFSTGTWKRSNRPGNDTFRFRVFNSAGTIFCNAYVTVS